MCSRSLLSLPHGQLHLPSADSEPSQMLVALLCLWVASGRPHSTFLMYLPLVEHHFPFKRRNYSLSGRTLFCSPFGWFAQIIQKQTTFFSEIRRNKFQVQFLACITKPERLFVLLSFLRSLASHQFLTITFQRSLYCYPSFTDKESELQQGGQALTRSHS